ncbi:zinc ribbon domain-containing protein [Paenibacillus sp. HJL G12]|uniref:Zinc ribbon domain-containing protein n=1 Tax=Paenibacillus dendrobii TaxID=2691084 RepID=A0A7X3ILQ9_9BACL|nr:zinc ribbon domain-containing protein [Paenibacillus dendrobii]MWV45721.1 zinc ribbon domain-containing protein [Paenibacillus dendrobii]
MNILQRIKDGANRATEKAQGAVEVGKLNGQITEVEKEMELHFVEMGRAFYDGYRSEDLTVAERDMMKHSKACDGLQKEIDDLRRRIAELKNEKLCKCGRTVELDANFCPACGRNLNDDQPAKKRAESRPASSAAVLEEEDYGETKIYKEPVHEYKEYKEYEEHEEDEEDEEDDVRTYDREEAGASAERKYEYDYSASSDWEESEEEEGYPDERERRQAEELERERERQLELDRRIRYWKENNEEDTEKTPADTQRDTVKCQICRADLPKGSKWCPRCGAEQI